MKIFFPLPANISKFIYLCQMNFIKIYVCLSELPEDKIRVAYDGKRYVDLCVAARRSILKGGDTHSVSIARTKKDWLEMSPVLYVGGGRQIHDGLPDDNNTE